MTFFHVFMWLKVTEKVDHFDLKVILIVIRIHSAWCDLVVEAKIIFRNNKFCAFDYPLRQSYKN